MKVFQILGQSVSISDEREAYNRYRLMFQAAADKAERQFYDLYQQNKSLDQVIKNVPNQAKKCIQPAIELSIKILMQHHVLSIDAAQFEEQYAGIHNFWGEPYAEVYDQYAEIVLDQKDLDEYRVQRRQSRSRWAGGGFGVSGALKGAATAGVLNMMSGAGHMAFNGVGKIISSISANSQKNKIYSDPNTYSNIALGIWNAVFSLHIALIECLRFTEADPLPFAGAIDEEDVRHAEAILNNAHLTQTIEQCRAAMIESFRLNPYQEDWYRFALKQFGDSDGMLEEVEQYFGFSVVRDEKEKQLNDFAHSLPLDTEELAVSALQKVEQKKEILHYSGDTDQTKIIRDTVDRFDLEYRTVDGITLSTRQEAEAARLELSEIEEIEGQIDHQSLSSIAESEHKISNFSSPVAKAHQEMLHQEWTDLDNELRTVSTLLPDGKKIRCRTYQQAEQLRPIVQNLKQRLDACGEDTASEAPLNELKEALCAQNLPVAIKECYIREIDNRLEVIDRALRTTLKKEYPTREKAKAAEQEYEEIKSNFFYGHPRKNAARFRAKIEAADFSDTIKEELLDELFQLENANEIKTAKALSTVSTIILLGIVISSYLFQLSGTAAFAEKDIIVFGTSLKVTDIQVVERLAFLDGLKNGLGVFGRCIGDVFVHGFLEYIGGFEYGLLGNVLWAVFGWMWLVVKQMIIVIPRYLVSLFTTFAQTASIGYYIGYVIGSAIPFAASQLNFDEDNQTENVQRIKSWTVQKISLAVVIVLLVVGISVYFIKNNF